MTTQEKLLAVTKAIQEVCPDLMELKFGCRLEDKDAKIYKGKLVFIEWHFNDCPLVIPEDTIGLHWQVEDCLLQDSCFSMGSLENNPTYNVLGSPITLSHILRWLEVIEKDSVRCFVMSTNGCINEMYFDGCVGNYYYNLENDTLDQQSPEFINFLYSLLPTV
jgi:hypothetical protein